VYELRAGQVAASQVGPEAAFTVDAVTIPALDVLGLQPKNLALLGVTGGLRRDSLRERE
jgi:hypothetical protein